MNDRLRAIGPALAAVALAAVAGSAAAAVSTQMPPEQYQGSVGYLTGGIGQTEAQAFERQMGRHRLAIELLEHAGRAEAFTADARVRIIDARGRTVLDTRAAGPFVLVDLAPGRYSVTARLKHRTLTKRVVVVTRSQLARATFEFPPRTDG